MVYLGFLAALAPLSTSILPMTALILRKRKSDLKTIKRVAFILILLPLLLTFISPLFPKNIVTNGIGVNIVSHSVGLFAGMIIPHTLKFRATKRPEQ